MKFALATLSEVGPRPSNEDAIGAWELSENSAAAAVADGLGGHVGGGMAACMAIDTLEASLRSEPARSLESVAKEVHKLIRLQQEKDPAAGSMATTLSAAVFEGGHLRGVHCGDSRLAVARGSGIRRLTTDHTEAQRLFEKGKLTREELHAYPRGHVLDSALGIHREPRIDSFSFEISLGDRFFFTTDGLHSKIRLQELMHLSFKASSPHMLVELVASEMKVRKPDDNFSLAVVFAL